MHFRLYITSKAVVSKEERHRIAFGVKVQQLKKVEHRSS